MSSIVAQTQGIRLEFSAYAKSPHSPGFVALDDIDIIPREQCDNESKNNLISLLNRPC